MSEAVKGFLNRFRKYAEDREATLKRFAVDTISDEKLSLRLDLIESLSILISERDNSIVDRVDYVEKMVRLAAMAWGCAGTSGVFAEIMRYWEQLLGLWQPYADMHQDSATGRYMEVTAMSPRRIRDLITDFGEINVLWLGKLIVDISMNARDVSPAYVALIQSSGYSDDRPPERESSLRLRMG